MSNYVTYGTDLWCHTLACQSGRTLACISVSTSGFYEELHLPVFPVEDTVMSTASSDSFRGKPVIVILL